MLREITPQQTLFLMIIKFFFGFFLKKKEVFMKENIFMPFFNCHWICSKQKKEEKLRGNCASSSSIWSFLWNSWSCFKIFAPLILTATGNQHLHKSFLLLLMDFQWKQRNRKSIETCCFPSIDATVEEKFPHFLKVDESYGEIFHRLLALKLLLWALLRSN